MAVIEEILVGKLASIIFENDQNLYKVMRITVDLKQSTGLFEDEVVVTGQFVSIHYETTYQFFGRRVQHPRFGSQFAVTRYQQIMPTSRKGLIDYLSSHRFKGIGPKTATQIVDTLGDNVIDRILSNPAVLKEVKGLSKRLADQLTAALQSQQGTERIFLTLSEWGLSPLLAEKVYKVYQAHTLDKIRENPYRMVTEIEGIGFTKADQLADQLGIEADSLDRVAAAVVVAVTQAAIDQGDTYLSRLQALESARDLLEKSRRFLLDDATLQAGLERALLEEKLVAIDQKLVLPSIFYAEYGASQRLREYFEAEMVERFEESEIDQAINDVIQLLKINYDESQRKALKLAMQSPLSIITGGPGTGKTTLVQGIIYLHAILHGYDLADLNEENFESPIRLAAPTGRAAKRMQESSHLPATTIHRLIGYNRESTLEGFEPIAIDGSLLIVDEMSMVDIWLLNWLLQAIPYEMQVVFVGDRDQLPSVGPGKVFADLIAADVIPTITLTQIYRQAQDSSIVQLAHQIRQGHLPQNLLEKQDDRSFIPCAPQQVDHVVAQVVQAAVKKGFTSQNLQVLAPMYKGLGGINQINQLMQNMLNPASSKKREIQHFDRVFRVGDKVLQLVNNADQGIYNGDIGMIVALLTAKEAESNSEELVVAFDEREIHYSKGDLDQLTLAYCCSIHKAQGSEYDLVILPLVDLYSRMLRRDIIYTAVTRASKSLVMIGNPLSFQKAVNQEQSQRHTQLKDFLQLNLEKKTPTKKDQVKASNQAKESMAQELLVDDPVLSDSHLSATKNTPVDKLTDETIWLIDPMIGMENLKPTDFME